MCESLNTVYWWLSKFVSENSNLKTLKALQGGAYSLGLYVIKWNRSVSVFFSCSLGIFLNFTGPTFEIFYCAYIFKKILVVLQVLFSHSIVSLFLRKLNRVWKCVWVCGGRIH